MKKKISLLFFTIFLMLTSSTFAAGAFPDIYGTWTYISSANVATVGTLELIDPGSSSTKLLAKINDPAWGIPKIQRPEYGTQPTALEYVGNTDKGVKFQGVGIWQWIQGGGTSGNLITVNVWIFLYFNRDGNGNLTMTGEVIDSNVTPNKTVATWTNCKKIK